MVKYVTVAEISEFVLDGTHGSPKRTEDPTGVPLLSAKNILDGEVSWDNFDRVLQDEWRTFSRRLSLRPGDVLMTCVGSIGRAAVWTGNRPAVLLRSVAVIRPQRQVVPKFLEYYIRSSVFQGHLVRRTKQASQGGIYLDDIRQLPVPVVPEAEQHRIVKLLDEADELRRRREQGDRRTADLIPALFYEMFGDPAANLKRSSMSQMGEVIRIISGHAFKKAEYASVGVRLFQIANVSFGTVDWGTVAYLPEDYQSLYPELVLVPGDVIMALNRPILGGKVKVAELSPHDCPAILYQRVGRLIPKTEDLERPFLFGFMQTGYFQNELKARLLGSDQPYVNPTELVKIHIPLPPISLQRQFAARVAEIRALQARQAESRRRLDDLFQSMLHRAFQGEL